MHRLEFVALGTSSVANSASSVATQVLVLKQAQIHFDSTSSGAVFKNDAGVDTTVSFAHAHLALSVQFLLVKQAMSAKSRMLPQVVFQRLQLMQLTVHNFIPVLNNSGFNVKEKWQC